MIGDLLSKLKTTVPMEPMDSYLCVLLKLELITSPGSYTQAQICMTIRENQEAFDSIYNNPSSRTAAVNSYMDAVRQIDVFDKQEDCP